MIILHSKVVDLLKTDTLLSCRTWLENDQIVLEISNHDFEKNMGFIVRRIQIVIDNHIPQREHNLTIIIRNKDKQTDNLIKIWSPVDVMDNF